MRTKNTIIRVIITALVVAVLLAGCTKKETAKTSQPAGALRVNVSEARIGTVKKTITYSGVLKGIREVPIAPGMSSWINKILVKEGQKVKKGQLLAKLSPEQMEQAKAQLDALEKNYQRMKRLYEKGAITQSQFDQIEASYLAAKAGYQLASKNTRLRAPFDGIVAEVNTQEGQFFNAMMGFSSAPSVLTLVDISKVKLEVEVSDRDVALISPGQEVMLKVDAFPETTFTGKVENVDEIADPRTGTYTVKIIIDNPKEILKSGMYASAKIVIDKAESVVVIPTDALVNDTLVYIAEGNTAKARKVKTGVKSAQLVQIIDGVKPGEKVITTGTIALFDGAPIKYQPKITKKAEAKTTTQ